MGEKIAKSNKNRLLVLPVALTLGLGLTACGSGSAKVSEKPQAPKTEKTSALSVQAKYFPNGTREIVIAGSDTDGFSGSNDGGANIFEFCDGRDSVEETLQDGEGPNQGSQASALSRSVNYPGCANGKLTPSDFAPPHSVAVTK